MVTLNHLRTAFLDYFQRHNHHVFPSSSLVPRNDPTLLFTNAGMVQFKDIFTGKESTSVLRAASSQKCLRAGGKHNDLENVGYTTRHHTFFEMLGNFSFGDYFKAEAIEWAWTFLTQELALPTDRLYVTVYAQDLQARTLWKKIANLSDHRIISIATQDNFWSMGDTGPCGPCSEIFYDHGSHIPGGLPGTADQDGDRFVEIWNLVFMQFEQYLNAEGQVVQRPLPKPSIDTGMGLERIAAVLQGVSDNYHIDLFQQLIRASQDLGVEQSSAVSHRVIADHLRSICFLIADGISPSNEGRGYVLRRIMRRAMRHGHLLGWREPKLYRLVTELVSLMGTAYPELNRAQALIEQTIQLEEQRFQLTLGKGLKMMQETLDTLPLSQVFPGEVAFKLYDTYGFPLDLTQDILKNQHRNLDTAGFERCMDIQRQEARAAWSGSGEIQTHEVWFQLKDQHGATDFLGYAQPQAEATVLALVTDKPVVSVQKGKEIYVLVNQTPFYAESGGQVGDIGTIKGLNTDLLIHIKDTQKKAGDLIVHHGEVVEGTLKLGDTVLLEINEDNRRAIRGNHSATHLLHSVLHKILGPHVAQKGSQVRADRFRFDFNHPTALQTAQIRQIEHQVNAYIRSNVAVTTSLNSPEEAMAQGAMALFGEKYGAEVRVVSMGNDNNTVSLELCGGTHVTRTGDIGLFKIIQETGIAAGIRRIEAMTGFAAEQYTEIRLEILEKTAALLKTSVLEVPEKVHSFITTVKNTEKKYRDLLVAQSSNDTYQEHIFTGYKVGLQSFENISVQDLKKHADRLKQKIHSGVVCVTSFETDKITIVIGVTNDLLHVFNAHTLIQDAALHINGKGGGRNDLAQAGGSNKDAYPTMIQQLLKNFS